MELTSLDVLAFYQEWGIFFTLFRGYPEMFIDKTSTLLGPYYALTPSFCAHEWQLVTSKGMSLV